MIAAPCSTIWSARSARRSPRRKRPWPAATARPAELYELPRCSPAALPACVERPAISSASICCRRRRIDPAMMSSRVVSTRPARSSTLRRNARSRASSSRGARSAGGRAQDQRHGDEEDDRDQQLEGHDRCHPRRARISCTRAGPTSNRSPTTTRSANSAIGASGSRLTATIVSAVCIPTLCWIAPAMPSAR